MPFTCPLLRAFVECHGSVAEVCLLVQVGQHPAQAWQWQLPYLLWAHWGTGDTAVWLCEQFRQHDQRIFCAVGSEPIRQALQRGLERHRKYHRVTWLTDCQP